MSFETSAARSSRLINLLVIMVTLDFDVPSSLGGTHRGPLIKCKIEYAKV